MRMKNTYCISYPGGMFGEFICCQVTKSKNFYPNLYHSSELAVNRYRFIPILDHLIYTLTSWPDISNELKHQISSRFPDKHILLKSHHYDESATMNLENFTKVKLYCNKDQWLLPYLLFIIKVYPSTITLREKGIGSDLNEVWMLPLLNDQSKFPEYTKQVFENIKDLTQLELEMLISGFSNCKSFIENKIKEYEHLATINSGQGDWLYLNPLDLLINPEQHMPKWKEVFDLDEDFNFNVLKSYHKTNLDLIEKKFGKSYEDISQGDYVSDIANYCENLRSIFK